MNGAILQSVCKIQRTSSTDRAASGPYLDLCEASSMAFCASSTNLAESSRSKLCRSHQQPYPASHAKVYTRCSPDRRALGSHIRLADGERVDIRAVLQACKRMIYEPVRALVAPDGVHDVKELRVRREAPVVLRDLRRREVLPAIAINGVRGNFNLSAWSGRPATESGTM